MKTSPSNNPLDNFIQNALKTPDVDLHPFDWSEIEVLLRHEQKSIRHLADKKTILLSAAAVIILLGAFGIFKVAHYYYSLPEETETRMDSTQNTFIAIDPQKTSISDSIVTMIDSVKIDSSLVLRDEKHKTDSILAASDAFLKKIIQKQDKKQKQTTKTSPVDTTIIKTTTETLPPVDTSKHPTQEIKTNTPPVSADTSKTSDPSKKSKKNKKQKNTSADSSKTETPPQTKPDSLKQ